MSGISTLIGTPQNISTVVGALRSMTASVAAGSVPAPPERQVVFATKNGFPENGRADTLYVAVDEARCYYYAGASGYICVGSDSDKIKEIICGLQEENNNG